MPLDLQDERQRDAEFAAAWDDSLDVARAEVEHEIYRRAQEGVDEPVYVGKYREQVVGTVRRYSDRGACAAGRALMPSNGPKQWRGAALPRPRGGGASDDPPAVPPLLEAV